MARYFFDSFDGEKESCDELGLECERGQVEAEAMDALPDLARDKLPDGPTREFWVKVRDQNGRYIFQATLSLRSEWME